jgi:hypothetical protein
MITTASDWQVLPLLAVIESFLGMLGALYLAYDLFGRQQEILHRLVWVFTSGLLFAIILLVSCFFLIGPGRLIGPERFADGNLPLEIWRLIGIFSGVVLIMQFVYSSPVPSQPSRIDGFRLILALVESSIGLLALGAVIAPQDSSPLMVVIFALPGVFAFGLINGFAPVIQWWMLHLPEMRMAAIGALLIFCGFAMAVVPPIFNLLGIPFH